MMREVEIVFLEAQPFNLVHAQLAVHCLSLDILCINIESDTFCDRVSFGRLYHEVIESTESTLATIFRQHVG